ncbi:MAG: hypothetical protein NXH82_17340 [Rhodobacteraceae bacterium]|nr:hypothetical protein [Paracoccaceae bacterium]
MKQGAALFAATATSLGIAPVKLFPTGTTPPAISGESRGHVYAQSIRQTRAQGQARREAPRKSRGISLATQAEAKACCAGTKQAVLVHLLSCPHSAIMNALIDAPGQLEADQGQVRPDMGHERREGLRHPPRVPDRL